MGPTVIAKPPQKTWLVMWDEHDAAAVVAARNRDEAAFVAQRDLPGEVFVEELEAKGQSRFLWKSYGV
jgi:hypothetical protein